MLAMRTSAREVHACARPEGFPTWLGFPQPGQARPHLVKGQGPYNQVLLPKRGQPGWPNNYLLLALARKSYYGISQFLGICHFCHFGQISHFLIFSQFLGFSQILEIFRDSRNNASQIGISNLGCTIPRFRNIPRRSRRFLEYARDSRNLLGYSRNS